MSSFFVSEALHDGQWLKLKTNDPASFRFVKKFRVGAYALTEKKPGRSNDANAYCWRLCSEIGRRIGLSKEDIYRQAIKDAGVFDTFIMSHKAAQRFASVWQGRGEGWFVDHWGEFGKSSHVVAYYGSSCYTAAEMSTLIDYLVQDAKSIGIETLSPREQSLLLEAWDYKNKVTEDK